MASPKILSLGVKISISFNIIVRIFEHINHLIQAKGDEKDKDLTL